MPVSPPRARPPQSLPSSSFETARNKPAAATTAPRGVTNTASSFEPAAAAAALPSGPPKNAWTTYPHAADIDRIVAIKDDATRNLEITQGYYDLSHAMGKLLGTRDANWTVFAVAASKTVGESIRHEDLPKILVETFNRDEAAGEAMNGFERMLARVGLSAPDTLQDLLNAANDSLDGVRTGLAGGNRAVFNEIGREYSTFIETFDGDTSLDPVKLQKYLSHFKPEQAQLRQAFHAYARAMFETNPDKRSEEILLGNLLIGYHEQSSLTPFIGAAMNAPIEEVVQGMLEDKVNRAVSRLPFGGRFLRGALEKTGLVERMTAPLAEALGRVFRRTATELMLALKLPEETLRLGRDLPGTASPPALEHIQSAELRAVIDLVDAKPGSLAGSAARDWYSFEQRMNWIGDLFRSRQQEPSLWDSPFGETVTYGERAVA